MSKSLLLAALVAAAACGGSSKPVSTAPLPDDTAEARPADPAPPEEAAPPEAPPPEYPPFAEAPPPSAPGAPGSHVAKALALIPGGVRVIIGVDVARVATTPLGELLRKQTIGDDMPPSCGKFTAAQFGNLVLGGGEDGMVVVSDGKLAEKDVLTCVGTVVKPHGAKLDKKKIHGRTVHVLTGANEPAFASWTKGGQVLYASTEPGITAALDAKAPKVGADLTALAGSADHARMLWAAMIVPVAELAASGLPTGRITGDVSLRAWIELTDETVVDLVLGFASEEDARRFDLQIRAMLMPMRGAQDLEPVLSTMQLGRHGKDIHAVVHIDAALTQQLLEAVVLQR